MPSLPKFVAATLFTACLNWADFFSDWYVVLQYACVINSDMSVGCGSGDGSGELQACEAHPWWFAIGLSLLVISNVVQSCCWAFCFCKFLGEHAKDQIPETCAGRLGLLLLLFLLAFAQLHYLADIAAACMVGAPHLGDSTDEFSNGYIFRELATKILESGPQLYLQSYILFATGSHGDPMKLASVAISILALGHGLMKLMSMEGPSALAKPAYWMITFLWFSSDQALRSAGYALVLAPGARPFGMVLVALAALASCGLGVRDGFFLSLCCENLQRGGALFFFGYLVPGFLLFENADLVSAWPVLLVRWVEMATCALLSYAFATTNCGHAPTNEVLGLLGLLLFNVLCHLIRYFCFDHETGDFLYFVRGTSQKEGGKEGTKDLATGPSATAEAAAAS